LANEITKNNNNSKIYLSFFAPYEKGMAEEWISTHLPKFEAGELANFAIVLKETQELIGAIGLTINKRFKRAELGYWIGKPYWNKGKFKNSHGLNTDETRNYKSKV